MNLMFLDIFEIEKNVKSKSVIFELQMAEFFFFHIKTNEKFLNETLFRLRRFSEIISNTLMDLNSIAHYNQDNSCNEYSLKQKIDLLQKKGIITTHQRSILHDIRMSGNDGIHNNVQLKTGAYSISRNAILDYFNNVFNELLPLILTGSREIQDSHYSVEYSKVERSQLVLDFQSRVETQYAQNLLYIERNHKLEINTKKELILELENRKKQELQILEDLYKEEISLLDKQLTIVLSEKEEIENELRTGLQNLEKEYETKLEALNNLYCDSKLKYRKEKLILDLQHKEKIRQLEYKYKSAISEKDSLIDKQKKQLKNLKILLVGVSSALVLAITGALRSGIFKIQSLKKQRSIHSEQEL